MTGVTILIGRNHARRGRVIGDRYGFTDAQFEDPAREACRSSIEVIRAKAYAFASGEINIL
jgi:hypothetical protein